MTKVCSIILSLNRSILKKHRLSFISYMLICLNSVKMLWGISILKIWPCVVVDNVVVLPKEGVEPPAVWQIGLVAVAKMPLSHLLRVGGFIYRQTFPFSYIFLAKGENSNQMCCVVFLGLENLRKQPVRCVEPWKSHSDDKCSIIAIRWAKIAQLAISLWSLIYSVETGDFIMIITTFEG